MDIAGALAGFVEVSSLRLLGKTANAPTIQVLRSPRTACDLASRSIAIPLRHLTERRFLLVWIPYDGYSPFTAC